MRAGFECLFRYQKKVFFALRFVSAESRTAAAFLPVPMVCPQTTMVSRQTIGTIQFGGAPIPTDICK